jgi:hypothetical protein
VEFLVPFCRGLRSRLIYLAPMWITRQRVIPFLLSL